MIKILILEDEIPARKKLIRFLASLEIGTEVVAEIDTVTAGIAYLEQHTVDLIFSDIELLDGNSFEIFGHLSIPCPIIFTTAYDHFWMNAFESNGIDYLLKPFTQERFQKAWEKFLRLRHSPLNENQQLLQLSHLIQHHLSKKVYKRRFVVRNHQGIYFVDVEKITYFSASEGVVFAYDVQGERHLLTEATLKEIENQLDPLDFFRLNRSELVHKRYIKQVTNYHKNALSVRLKGSDKQLVTSQSNTASFRTWLEW